MKIIVKHSKLEDIDAPMVLLGASKDFPKDPFLRDQKILADFINDIVEVGDFEGKKDQTLSTLTHDKLPSKRLMFVGCGKTTKLTLERLRQIIGAAARKARDLSLEKIAINIDSFQLNDFDNLELVEAIVVAVILGIFKNIKYKTKKAEKYKTIEELTLFSDSIPKETMQEAKDNGKIIAEAVNFCRELSWGPANYITPTKLAEEAKQIGKNNDVSVSIFDREKAKEVGLTSFLAVAQGTEEPPKFIIMEYGANKKDVDTLALIGKAITFDTGGISIKPSKDMLYMKADMTGGAVVLSIMKAISQLKPNLHIVALVPATDNMPSGKAYHPGDIITSYDGQTIEVISTDAEGRMVINDALAYATDKYKPNAMIDFATLTGSIGVALGNHAIGYFANDDQLAKKLEKASDISGERIWRMPLWKVYDQQLESDIADMKHTGGRPGGAITAARFLKKFVGETPWIHCDIAGYANAEKTSGYNPKGSKGPAVRLIVDLIRNWQEA